MKYTRSFQIAKDNYNSSFKLYDRINDLWYKLESGLGKNIEYELEQLAELIKEFKSSVKKIDINSLSSYISKEKTNQIKHNKNLFNEAIFMISRHIDSIKYADDLRKTMLSYIVKLHLPKYEYSEYADNEQTLAKKIISAVTHPDNIDDFKLKLNRIANNTMNIKEFKLLFYVFLKHILKEKEPELEKSDDFQTLKDYKQQLHISRPESRKSWKDRTGRIEQIPNVKKPAYGFRIKQ